MEIHRSARRHGIADTDVHHAVDNALVIDHLADDPERWLVIGPARSANLLEVIVMLTEEGTQMAIHAMPLRTVYRKLLER